MQKHKTFISLEDQARLTIDFAAREVGVRWHVAAERMRVMGLKSSLPNLGSLVEKASPISRSEFVRFLDAYDFEVVWQEPYPVSRVSRLLALDAALVAAEDCGVGAELIQQLQELLGPILEAQYPVFADFLHAQKSAVESLAKAPHVFGHEAL